MKLKELIEQIAEENNISKSSIGRELGYTNASSFFTAITRETMPMDKRYKLCKKYGYKITYQKL